MVFGTPTTLMPISPSRVATPRVSSPPMAISASTPLSCNVVATLSNPWSTLNGFVRDEPRMVPPRGRMPRTSGTPSGIVMFSSGPFQPSRKPTNSWPYTPTPLRTTARITALSPGQSPPPVSTPMRMDQTLGGVGQGVPPGQVVARVGEGVVLVRRSRRERGRTGVLPLLAQLVGEPRYGTAQRAHVAPQLREHDVVVTGHPGPELDRLAGLGQEGE